MNKKKMLDHEQRGVW